MMGTEECKKEVGWRMTTGCLENENKKMQVVKECTAAEMNRNVN